MHDVGEWLEELKLGQYAQAFAENNIDQDLVFELTEDDLERLGIASLGHRKRLLMEIAALRSGLRSQAQPRTFGQPGATPQAGAEGERRQLTVMFCDLVGSTKLSAENDPEDLREVMRLYQDAVAGAATRYGGYVARYVGDGILVYFGWPQAYEDQAERAVRAGLDSVAAVEGIRFENHLHLRARVGIASGEVVIGDLVGDVGREVDAVTGETPNLAARLQGLADPGQVLIDAGTNDLVGEAFELEPLGKRSFKGFSQPLPVLRVAGEGKVESRFEAAHPGRLTPFVGRKHELGLIRDRWKLAKDAEGQVVLLTGEAGIGKSRMVQALCDAISEERHFRLHYQCSPFRTSSAFYPIIRLLERAAGFAVDDDSDARLNKLEKLLRQTAKDIDTDLPLFAALLSLPGEERYGALGLSPQQQRERTIDALINQLMILAEQLPVLFVLEDAQWIDPTTEALLGEATRRIANAPVLIVITSRPEYTPPWSELTNLNTIVLNRLSKDQASQVIKALAGDELAGRLVTEIATRADRVPLFVEELTRSLLESDDDKAEIPSSLQALLVSRLDRLGGVKRVAQLAATLGRSFHYRFIRAVSDLNDAELGRALTAMTEAGLLLQSGRPPQARYTFKHALIQDAAYGTLLRTTKQQYHAKIAEVLLNTFTDQATAEPEFVARHLSLAGLPEKAVELWLLAGQRAGERSAHVEAIVDLESGLKELERMPASQTRDRYEFDLRIALGASLLAVRGWSAPKVERNYERAQELSAHTGDIRKFFAALRGLFNVFLLRGEVANAGQLADRLLTIALNEQDDALLLEGYRTVGMCCFFAGKPGAAREHLARANAIYDRSQHHAHAFTYGTDPAVVGLSISGWVEWFLGDPEEARRRIDAALKLAEELQHPFSLAYARSLAASLYQTCRNPDLVAEHADAAIAVAEEHDFPYWKGWGTVMRGWSLAALGEPQKGIEMLQRGLEIYESTDARLIKPYILTLLAEMYGWAGLPLMGIEALDRAYGIGNDTDVCFYEPEALRVKGELVALCPGGNGEEYFERALKVARQRGARGLELRAAISAGRASLKRGERELALSLIAPICQDFNIRLTDPDLCDARELIETLDPN